jgi:hypothetical protein
VRRPLIYGLCAVLLMLAVVPGSARFLAQNGDVQRQGTDATLSTVQGDVVWQERFAVSSPLARVHHALAYDSMRGVVVLYGGLDSHDDPLGDIWEWDGHNWLQRFPITKPPSRYGHRLIYDCERSVIILFGGYDGNNRFGDTWEWNGNQWVQRFPTTSPQARSQHAFVYDSRRKRVVLFGGWGGSDSLNDTWEWDGHDWVQRFPTTSPPARYGHAATYDSARERTVLFGGWDNDPMADTWEWDGTNWMQRLPTTRPPERAYPALVYDSARKRVVLFGGSDNIAGGSIPMGDTWEWDGNSWVERFPAIAPLARLVHAMVYDSARRRSVLFGGANRGFLGDTWEYGPAFFLSATPATQLTAPGAVITYSITVTQVMISSTIDLGLTGLPAGAAKQFEPELVIPPAQAVLTVTTSTTTPLGLYPLVITGSGGGFTNMTQVTFTVALPDRVFLPVVIRD